MGDDPTLADSAIRFLENDFNQAFEQLRHYDKQMLSVCQFTTTVYSGILALTAGCLFCERERLPSVNCGGSL